MDEDPSPSNTAGFTRPSLGRTVGQRHAQIQASRRTAEPDLSVFLAGLDAWKAALLAWAAALGDYAREVGDSGARVAGPRWKDGLRNVAEARDLVSASGPPPGPAAQIAAGSLRALMDAGDAFETAAYRLGTAAPVYLDPNVQAAAMTGLSRTFSDSLRRLARAARDAHADAKASQWDALGLADGAGALFGRALSVEEIARAFVASAGDATTGDASAGDSVRGGTATALYTSALLCTRSARAADLLESAKNAALACVDDRAHAIADAEALDEYHPLQAMGFAAQPPGPRRAPRPGEAPVDLAPPQADYAVTYDPAPLIERRRALDFGPLSSTFSGLNYKLVDRLRTISVTKLGPPGAGPGPARPDRASALLVPPLLVTTDRGATVQELGPADFAPPAERSQWAPFAGARPRVAAYGDAAATLILDRLRAGRAEGWTPDLRLHYEAAVESGALPSGECGTAPLVDALVSHLGLAYSGAPGTPGEFYELVVPEEPAPEGYLAAAAAQVGAVSAEIRLREFLVRPPGPVPYAVFEREVRVLQALHAADASRALWLGLQRAFRSDAELFELPEPRRRSALLQHFRRTVEGILAGAPVLCAPPSLKLFAAQRSAGND